MNKFENWRMMEDRFECRIRGLQALFANNRKLDHLKDLLDEAKTLKDLDQIEFKAAWYLRGAP